MSKIKDKFIDNSNNYTKLLIALTELAENNIEMLKLVSKMADLLESNDKAFKETAKGIKEVLIKY